MTTAERPVEHAHPASPTAEALPGYAELLCRFVRSARRSSPAGADPVAAVGRLENHEERGTWPIPEDLNGDP